MIIIIFKTKIPSNKNKISLDLLKLQHLKIKKNKIII